MVILYFATSKYENLGKKTFTILTTQFIVIHILNVGMVLSTCEPFLLKLLPLNVTLLEFLFYHSSKYNLLYTCVECAML
jgi:hypothetical protein